MRLKSKVPRYLHSDLEKVLKELERLHQEGLSHLVEIARTQQKILHAYRLAQIEAKVYSGIKKYFKKVKNV